MQSLKLDRNPDNLGEFDLFGSWKRRFWGRKRMLKKNPVILIAIGLVLLAIGGFMQFTAGGPPRADAALVQACETEMQSRGGDADMIARCQETAFASAMTATDAESAARAISAANNSEVGGGMLAMFLIGIGLALTIGGIVIHRGRGRTPA